MFVHMQIKLILFIIAVQLCVVVSKSHVWDNVRILTKLVLLGRDYHFEVVDHDSALLII